MDFSVCPRYAELLYPSPPGSSVKCSGAVCPNARPSGWGAWHRVQNSHSYGRASMIQLFYSLWVTHPVGMGLLISQKAPLLPSCRGFFFFFFFFFFFIYLKNFLLLTGRFFFGFLTKFLFFFFHGLAFFFFFFFFLSLRIEYLFGNSQPILLMVVQQFLFWYFHKRRWSQVLLPCHLVCSLLNIVFFFNFNFTPPILQFSSILHLMVSKLLLLCLIRLEKFVLNGGCT